MKPDKKSIRKKVYDPAQSPSADAPAAKAVKTARKERFSFRTLKLPPAFSRKNVIWRAAIALICAVLLLIGNLVASGGLAGLYKDSDTEYLRARVVDILSRDEKTYPLSETEFARTITLTFTAEVTEGERRGEILTVVQQSDPYYQAELNEVRVGDSVIVAVVPDMENVQYQYQAHVRTAPLIVLTVLFGVALLALAEFKGLSTLFMLGYTLLSVYAVLVPAILSGQNVYVWTVLVALFLSVMPPLIHHGPNAETLLASAGGFLGAGVTMAVAAVMDRILEFTGVIDEQSNYLAQINSNAPINLRGILFACIVLVAVGAQESLAWKLADSTRRELTVSPALSRHDIYRFGLEVGRRNIAGPAQIMTAAFIGASLPSTLLVFSSNISLLSLFNRELILFQILQLLAGLIGMLATVLLTSLLCSLLFPTAFAAVYLPDAQTAGIHAPTLPAGTVGAAADAAAAAEKAPANTAAAEETPVPAAAPAPAKAPAQDEPAAPETDVAASNAQPEPDDPENTPFRMPEVSDAEQRRRDEIDAVEEDPGQTQSYRSGFFDNFARLYRELDEDFDAADERSRKRHGVSKK